MLMATLINCVNKITRTVDQKYRQGITIIDDNLIYSGIYYFPKRNIHTFVTRR